MTTKKYMPRNKADGRLVQFTARVPAKYMVQIDDTARRSNVSINVTLIKILEEYYAK